MTSVIVSEPQFTPSSDLRSLGKHAEIIQAPHLDQVQFRQLLEKKNPQVAIINLDLRVAQVELDLAPSLRCVATPTTGHDHIDVSSLGERGAVLLSLRGEKTLLSSIPSTAEMTWWHVLSLARSRFEIDRILMDGQWTRTEPGVQLSGETLGIVGMGRLGKMVDGYARAFGMKVSWFDLKPSVQGKPSRSMTLDHLLAESRFVSIHIPGDAQNAHFVDDDFLGRMQQTSYLINTSRGSVVDEAAVARALRAGSLAGYGADVLAYEESWNGEIAEMNPIWRARTAGHNVSLSPHTGGYTLGAIRQTRSFITQKVTNWLSN